MKLTSFNFRYSPTGFSTLLFIYLLLNGAVTNAKEKPKRSVIVTPDEEKIRDSEGYKAISEIHREMDDDHSGSIDRKETTGFMMEDMQMRLSDRARKEQAFHGDDEAITVDDLWEAWFESKERAWTTEEVVEWLVSVVNLPMYADTLTKYKIDGTYLPRLAMHNQSFMINLLNIRSSVHRQKLRLNALDVVLFGHRNNSSRTKDILLGLSLVLLTALILLYVRLQKKSSLEKRELSSRLMQLKSMEDEFESAQKTWNEERNKRTSSDVGISQTEVENLKIQLEEAERRLEQHGVSGGGTPLALQPLLRKTCENELMFLEKQRQDCVNEMKEAIDMVDKLQKKQSSVLSSIRLATGAASASDQVDSKIFALKSRMEKIHSFTKETQERWMQIESLCGFPLLYMNEYTSGMQTSASASHFYTAKSGASSIASSASHQNGNSAASLNKPLGPKMSSATNSTIGAPTPSMATLSASSNGFVPSTAALSNSPTDSDIGATIAFRPKLPSDEMSSLSSYNSSSTDKKKKGIIKSLFKRGKSSQSLTSSTDK